MFIVITLGAVGIEILTGCFNFLSSATDALPSFFFLCQVLSAFQGAGKREKRLPTDLGFSSPSKLSTFFALFAIGSYSSSISKISSSSAIPSKVIGRFLLSEEPWLSTASLSRLLTFLGFGRNEDNPVFPLKLVEEFDVFFSCVGLGRTKPFPLPGSLFSELREGCLTSS